LPTTPTVASDSSSPDVPMAFRAKSPAVGLLLTGFFSSLRSSCWTFCVPAGIATAIGLSGRSFFNASFFVDVFDDVASGEDVEPRRSVVQNSAGNKPPARNTKTSTAATQLRARLWFGVSTWAGVGGRPSDNSLRATIAGAAVRSAVVPTARDAGGAVRSD